MKFLITKLLINDVFDNLEALSQKKGLFEDLILLNSHNSYAS